MHLHWFMSCLELEKIVVDGQIISVDCNLISLVQCDYCTKSYKCISNLILHKRVTFYIKKKLAFYLAYCNSLNIEQLFLDTKIRWVSSQFRLNFTVIKTLANGKIFRPFKAYLLHLLWFSKKVVGWSYLLLNIEVNRGSNAPRGTL